jgi:hypothetical protein
MLLLLILSLFLPTDQIRNRYYKSISSEKEAEILYDELKNLGEKSPFYLAYQGATESLLAKHAFNPINKMKWLKRADSTLRKAISARPQELEFRFLRFSYQHYVPGFLGYSKEIDEDMTVMLQLILFRQYGEAPVSLVNNAIQFMKETGRGTPQQKKILESLISP